MIYSQFNTIIYVDNTTINTNTYKVWSEDELIMFYHRSCSNNHGTSFIEGIGNVLGPLSHIDTLDSLRTGEFLSVFYRTIDSIGTTDTSAMSVYYTYGYSWYEFTNTQCPPVRTINLPNAIAKLKVTIQPNPATTKANIVFSKTITNGNIIIYNNQGQHVYSNPIYNKEQLSISNVLKNTGMYFYFITDFETGSSVKGKFMFVQ